MESKTIKLNNVEEVYDVAVVRGFVRSRLRDFGFDTVAILKAI
jgi:hypothetical protein